MLIPEFLVVWVLELFECGLLWALSCNLPRDCHQLAVRGLLCPGEGTKPAENMKKSEENSSFSSFFLEVVAPLLFHDFELCNDSRDAEV